MGVANKNSGNGVPKIADIVRKNRSEDLGKLLELVRAYYPGYTLGKLKSVVDYVDRQEAKARQREPDAPKKAKRPKKEIVRRAPKKPAASEPAPDLAGQIEEIKKEMLDGYKAFGQMVYGWLDVMERVLIQVQLQQPLVDAAKKFSVQ